jgi:hypothetical protein
MNTLLLAVIIVVWVTFLVALAKGRTRTSDYPYRLSKYLLSKSERSFFGVLVQAVGSNGLVFSKVRVADVIAPKKGLNRSDWQRAFNGVSAKHFDFLICDPGDCSVKLAVELDDARHNSVKSQKRDVFVNGACESAGLPLLRIKAAKAYVVADIQHQLDQALLPRSADQPKRVAPIASSEHVSRAPQEKDESPRVMREAFEAPISRQTEAAQQPEPEPISPPCPTCGEPMVRRRAKSGSNAGREFWGCSTFPRCRGVEKINA